MKKQLFLFFLLTWCLNSAYGQTLFLQKSDVNTPYSIGDTINYSLIYQVSTSDLHDGVIIDTLPDIVDTNNVFLLYTTGSNVDTATFDPVSREVKFTLNSPLSPGAAIEINIRALLEVSACETGTVFNVASFGGNNSAGVATTTVYDTAATFILGPDPSLERFIHTYESGTADTLFVFDMDCEQDYRFVTGIRNNSTICARNVQLIDSIPTGMHVSKIYTGTDRTAVNPNASFGTISVPTVIQIAYQTNNSGGTWLSTGISNPILLTNTNQELDVNTFGLAAGDTITHIRWTFEEVPPYYTYYTPTSTYRWNCCTRNFTQGFLATYTSSNFSTISQTCVRATYSINDSIKTINNGAECIAIKATLPASDDVSIYKNVPNRDNPYLFSFAQCTGSQRYVINYENNTFHCIDSVTVVDSLPANLYVTGILTGTGAMNLPNSIGFTTYDVIIEYLTNNSGGTWLSTGISNPITLNNTNQLLDVNTFGLAAGDTIIAVRWFYESLPPYAGYYEPINSATWTQTQQNSIGLDVALRYGNAGQTITNCTEVNYQYNGNSIAFTDGKPCTDITIDAAELVRFKNFYETDLVTTQGLFETDCAGGATMRYVTSVRNNSSFCADSVRVIDSIPNGMHVTTIYTGTNRVRTPSSFSSAVMDVVVEYQTNNSGSTWLSTGISNPIALTNTNQALDVSTFGLAPTDTITILRWTFSSLPAYYNYYNPGYVNGWMWYTRAFSQGFEATILFDSINHQIENCIDATQLVGGVHQPITTGNECVTVQSVIASPNNLAIYKTVWEGLDPYDYYWGQCSNGLRYVVIPRNTSAYCMDSVQVIDTLPPNIHATGIYTGTGLSRNVNSVTNYTYDVVIEYQTNNSGGAWLSTGISNPITLTNTNQFLDASTFGLAPTDSIIAIRWSYEYLPPYSGHYYPSPSSLWNTTRQNAPGFVAGLSYGTMGETITNCASIQYLLDGTPMVSTQGDPCTDIHLVGPSVIRYKHKYEGDPKTMDSLGVGASKRYVIGARNTASYCADSVVIMDTIPAELFVQEIYTGTNYTDPPSTSISTTSLSIIIEYQTNNSGGAWISTGISNPIALTTTNQALDVNSFGLAATDTIRAVRWTFPSLPAYYMPYSNNYPSYNWTYYTRVFSQGYTAQIVSGQVGDTITNCITAEQLVYDNVEVINQNQYRCSQTVLQGSSVQPTKTLLSAGIVNIGDTIRYELKVRVNDDGAYLENPMLVDLIDTTIFEFIQVLSFNDGGTGAPAPLFNMIGNYQGLDTTAFTWTFSGASNHTFFANDSFAVIFEVRPKLGIPAGAYLNEFLVESTNPDIPVQAVIASDQCTTIPTDNSDLDMDGSTTDQSCFSNRSRVEINTLASMVARPFVKGNSGVFHPFLDWSMVSDTFTFRLELENTGESALNNITAVDILPFVGDVDLGDFSFNRNSQFQPSFNGNITSSVGLTTSYSTENEICRTANFNTFPNPPSCNNPNWTTTAPPLSNVRSLLFDFGSLVLLPGENITIDFDMVIPPGTVLLDTAFNSFGFTSTRVDNGLLLEASGNKVGIITSNGSLPLTLVDFRGKTMNNHHALTWVTESEVNIVDFDIEMSTTGIYFETIATVAAQGNLSTNYYEYKNYDIHSLAEYYYYRLKIKEGDQTYSYSPTIVLDKIDRDRGIYIYPNPTDDNIYVQVLIPQQQKVQLNIYNSVGQVVYTKPVALNNSLLNIDLQSLESGVYILELVDSNGEHWLKNFVKK